MFRQGRNVYTDVKPLTGILMIAVFEQYKVFIWKSLLSKSMSEKPDRSVNDGYSARQRSFIHLPNVITICLYLPLHCQRSYILI